MSHVHDGELTAYADGAYAPADADAQRIAAHLALCPDCRNRLEQAHALGARAAEILAAATPAVVATPPFDQIRAQATARRARSTFPLTWAATVILALGIGWFGRGALRDPMLERALTRSEPPAQAQAEVAVVTPPPAASQAESRQSAPASAERTRTQRAPQVSASVDLADDASRRLAEVSAQPQDEVPPAAAGTSAKADVAGAAAEGRGEARSEVEYLTAAEAERRGIELLAVPELEILRVGLRADGVQVEQKLPDGKLITIATARQPEIPLGEAVGNRTELARQRETQPAAARAYQKTVGSGEAVDSVMLVRGNVLITISGALPADSLRKIGARIR